MGAQKLLRGHDATALLRHPQMAPVPMWGRSVRVLIQYMVP